MAVSIVAQGQPRELSELVTEALFARLQSGGYVVRSGSGAVVGRSPMSELAEKIMKAAPLPYAPEPDEQGILFVVLDNWLSDVSVARIPEEAMILREALFCDMDDRRRQDAKAS